MTINAAALLLGGHDAAAVALVCGNDQMTYGALRERVACAAAAWCAAGVAIGDRVAIALPDNLDWVVAYLGVIWAGGVAVAVNPRMPPDEWHTIVSAAGFRCILAATPTAMPTAMPLACTARMLAVDDWRGLVAGAPAIAPCVMEDNAPAFWSHSSGSSGSPKAVVHAHRFARHVAGVASDVLDVHIGDRLFASSRMFFVYPLGNSLFAGLKLGATIILDPQWPTAATVAATVATARPSIFFSVPSMYRSLLREGFATVFAHNGVRRCVSAGEALPNALRDEWQAQTGIKLVDGYGASETLCLVLVDVHSGEGFVPAPGVEVAALTASDQGQPTLVHIRAPTVALGYWNRPDAEALSFRDGAFCPADLFHRTESGTWRFGGREDSLVKICGRWVDLVALEERLIGACPDIVEAAAVAIEDEDGVASVAFFYAMKVGASSDGGIALHSLVSTLPPHQRPQSLHAVPALPRTATGKLLRRQLATMAAAR